MIVYIIDEYYIYIQVVYQLFLSAFLICPYSQVECLNNRRNKLQLVGVSAMSIASKVEEINDLVCILSTYIQLGRNPPVGTHPSVSTSPGPSHYSSCAPGMWMSCRTPPYRGSWSGRVEC